MPVIVVFLLTLVWASAVGANEDDSMEVVVAGHSQRFSRADLEHKITTHTLTVADPDHEAPVRYDAFALTDVLALAGGTAGHGDELVLEARDGYAPTVAYTALASQEAYLAFREHGNPAGFGLVKQGRTMVSPAPYFLVWRAGKSLGADFPWPYQLIRIEVVDFATKYAALYPHGEAGDGPEMRGFRRFKSQCLRCHSVNLQGGSLGPELNVPKNVTEFWNEAHLRAFILDASAYHARSKMPSFVGVLSAANIDDLLAYLHLMKTRKIQIP